MSLKAIDMQIAVNKSPDVGHVQREYQQRPPQEQAHLAVQQSRQAERSRKQSEKLEQSSRSGIKQSSDKSGKGKKRGNGSLQAGRGEETEATDSRLSEHPYKGKHIDLTL